jgi:hypothetical protein
MKWATRTDLHVDRTACAWLIRRFIDRDAEFVFISDPADLPADATPFDIPGQPFSHRDGDSTFEVMVRHYGIGDSGVARIGQVVHEADIEDERYDAPEAAGLDAIIRGLGRVIGDDLRLIDHSMPIYDGLLATLGSTEG